MRVGFVGLGKLGLPCALALEKAGHRVVGYDTSPQVRDWIALREVPYREDDVPELLASTSLAVLDSIGEVVEQSDIVFVAVQTPHAPAFDGTWPLTDDRRDFEYAYLVAAFREVASAALRRESPVTVAVISTVLPGTVNRFLRPLLNAHTRLVYNPFFIAMGTTVRDFLEPEFVLLATEDDAALREMTALYRTVHHRPLWTTSTYENAELVKVAYNTFIGLKVTFANMVMELSHKTGADCDEVIDALTMATERLLSPRYLRGGMGDGGGCHPRDNIAMSWLATQHDLSFDLFGAVMAGREAQSAWLADLVAGWADLTGLPILVLGKAYKPETDLTIGSPATLLVRQLEDMAYEVTHYDPHVDSDPLDAQAAVVFVATKHAEFAHVGYAPGSVVLDPFGYVPDQPGATVVRIGRKS